MKKKISLLIVLVLILSLAFTGCGKKDPTPDIKAQATGLLDAMQAGDVAKMGEFADPSIYEAGGDLESFGTLDSFVDDFIDSLGSVKKEDLSTEATDAIEKFKTFILENMVESYEIGEIKVEGDTATVDAVVNYGFDPDKIESIDVNSDLETLVNTYMSENMDALIEVLNSQGEEALQNKIVNDLIGDILDLFSNAVLDQGGMSENSVLILKNIEDKWVITEFKARV